MNEETNSNTVTQLIVFIIILIPAILTILCFVFAGIEYIIKDVTPLCERLMTVGGILGFITFVLCLTGSMAADTACQAEDESEE